MSGDIPLIILEPANVTYYNFTATQPADGHCEWKQFGYQGSIAEPGAMVFGIMTALQGLFGLWKSNHVAIGTRYMFSLLLGYGVASAGNTATLWNGFDKTAGAILNLLQAIVIIRLTNSLKFPPFSTKIHYHHLSGILISTFGLYPIITHVLGSSYDNPWVNWLTFDLIWAAIIIIVVTVFVFRKRYPQYQDNPEMFYLIFNATVTCILAYTFWLIDTFACHRVVAILRFYGLWLFLMGLTFYYLAVLDGFLQSAWQGYIPVITRWPKKFIILYVHLQWEKETTDSIHQMDTIGMIAASEGEMQESMPE